MEVESLSANPKKIKVLMALWNRVCPFKDAGEKRDARLHYIAAIIGHTVSSANDLTAAELKQVIDRLMLEVRPGGRNPASNNLREFPNRAQITNSQRWKIRQLESYLGWTPRPERLEGFLSSLFRVRRPEHLSHAQAWRAIEALFSLAARERVKADNGPDYEVGSAELAKASESLKEVLHSWRPPSVSDGLPPAA